MVISDSFLSNLCGRGRQGKEGRAVKRGLFAGVAAPHLTSRGDRGTVPAAIAGWMKQ
jgi:hypothetical protein